MAAWYTTHLLLKRSARAILVQTLVERWWDTTYTFPIADMEMTMTPHNFHNMTGLRCDEAFINLEGESGIRLGIDLLGRRYSNETIQYFDIKVDYKPLPQVTAENCAKMAKAILLYLLGAYLFPNGGPMVSLKWLALFRNFVLFLGHT